MLLARYSGTFGSEDIAAFDSAALRFVVCEALVRGVLDCSAVEAVPMSSTAARGQRQSILQDEDRVFVAPQPEMYQLSRAFADHQHIAGRIAPKVAATLE